jgi:mannonate dehydratase
MRETWRWFGPDDPVTLADARQAGAAGIVSALHAVPPGVAWTAEGVRAHREVIEAAGLTWDVVESIPVAEAVKTQTGDWRAGVAAWIASLEAVAAEGPRVVCYNFMPVLDWTRTDLGWTLPHGGRAMRFDLTDFAVFDIHVLARPGAAADFTAETVAAAAERAAGMDDAARTRLAGNIIAGLPGSMESWTLDTLRDALAAYANVDTDQLRRHLIDFLSEVVPHAERLDLRLCCHPDDPPWALLGLPRVMSTEADYRAVLDAVDSPASGMTYCTGSLGARGDNDLPGMAQRFGPRIHFAHLRNVRRDAETVPCGFFEDAHLEGQTDMVAVVAALMAEEARRRAEGRADAEIPMRPDHGQDILDDLTRGGRPGYPAVGRLKGLAELRGVARAVARFVN